MAEKKKPLSLNERHRLLSASHNRTARAPSNLPEEDKPQPQPLKVKVEGRRRLFKASSSTDDATHGEPSFGIMDFDSPLKKGDDKGAVDVDDQPSFSGIMDFDSPITKTRDTIDNSNPKLEEKTKVDKFERISDSSEESVDQLGGRDGNGDLNQGYDSAGSSFSVSPFLNTRAHSATAENATEEEDSFVDCEVSSNTLEEEKSQTAKLEVAKSRACSASGKKATDDDSFVESESSSSPPDEEKYQTAKLEEKQPLSNVSSKDNSAAFSGPKFSLIADFDTPPTTRDTIDDVSLKLEYISSEKKKAYKSETIPVTKEEALNHIGRDGDGGVEQEYSSAGFFRAHGEKNEPQGDRLGDHVTSLNPPEEDKPQPQRVKIEGRRRLCKVSSKDVENDDCRPLKESNFPGITDLDTPPTNIRDVLNDLSAKLDYLSIEKNTVAKVAPFSGSPLLFRKEEAPNQLIGDAKGEMKQKYRSAGSSFMLSPVQSLATKSKKQNAKNEAEGYMFVACEGNAKKVDDSQKKNYSTLKFQKSVLKENFLDVSDEDEDPYLILRGGQSCKRTLTKSYRAKENVTSSISVDTPKDSGAGDWVFEDGESIILSGKPSNYTLPGKVAKMLYPHQRSGLRWLWSIHCQGTGGILGDDMGLGKTMQICSFLAGLFHSRLIKRVMVVAPKTLLSHWSKELTAVGLSDKIREYFGSCAKARQYELQFIFQGTGILLTTYDIVRNNFKSLRGDSYFHDERSEDSITWDYTILDEGHIIKNPSTQRAKSLLEIPSGHRIIISGTPIQNNLKELWALFSFCCPQLLGDKKEFKDRYEHAILRGNDKNATDREKRIGSTVAKDLRERIKPYFLRRLKNEVFCDDEATNSVKLSKKNEIIVWLRLTQCQRQLYEAFLNSELVLSSFDKSPLAALTVLKKICDHPYLLTKRAAEDVLEGMETMVNQDDLSILERMALHLANPTDTEDFQNVIDNVSCKISFILSLLDNLIPEGHNVLIFSQTRKMLNFVQEAIISKGYRFLRIDGTTKISDREKIVKDFQEGEGAPIFLLTSQVGGLGLTLTNADRVIVVDPAWNPSTDNQSVDRAYRIGQKKDVIVYRLMTCGTIEEKIYKMQVFKGGLFKTATEQKEQTRYFSQQDLRELFSLPKEGFDVSVTQRQLDEEHDQQHIMDDSLAQHIEFLESHDIAGVSHHSLLFSKTAPTPAPVPDENEVLRRRETTFVGRSYSSSSVESNVDRSDHALNPKDVKNWKKGISSVSPNRLTESEIKDRIERLHQTFANKAMMSKLPDKGEKLKRQIDDLSLELEKISSSEDSVTEIIDLDDISGKLQSIHV